MRIKSQRSRNPNRVKAVIDVLYIFISLVIIGFAIVAFLNVDKYIGLFSLVFAFAAIENLITGILKIRYTRITHNGSLLKGILFCLLAVFLIGLAVITALVFWK